MDLRETSLGFYRAWHAGLGARHGLFVPLRERARSSAALARSRGLDAKAVGRWCEGARALGLLTRDAKGLYRLAAPHRATLGDPASAEHLGDHFHYLTQKSLQFHALDELLREGALRARPPPLDDVYAIATRWDHVAFKDLYLPSAPGLAKALARGIDVLDLGAGKGGWTQAMRRSFPRSRFAAADLDLAPLRALEGVEVHDARRLPRASFDLVFLGEVLAATRKPASVLRAAHRALRPGGRLVALEGVLPPPSRAPRGWGERLALAMSLDFSLDGSRFLTLGEIRAALADAGFGPARARDLGGSLYAVAARKPQA